MARCVCTCGHVMWNGNGKPIIWAFRVDAIRAFSEKNPDCVFSSEHVFFQMHDCVCGDPQEDLDCWYCSECHSLAVFMDSDRTRLDFEKMKEHPQTTESDLANWDRYIALRDEEYEKFMDFCEGMHPMEVIEQYSFRFRYWVSPDKKHIYAFNESGVFQFGYRRSRVLKFEV